MGWIRTTFCVIFMIVFRYAFIIGVFYECCIVGHGIFLQRMGCLYVEWRHSAPTPLSHRADQAFTLYREKLQGRGVWGRLRLHKIEKETPSSRKAQHDGNTALE